MNVGNVALAGGGWGEAYKDELRSFPHGKYDDQVDASSRAFMELTAQPGPMIISDETMRLAAIPARRYGQYTSHTGDYYDYRNRQSYETSGDPVYSRPWGLLELARQRIEANGK